MQQAVFLTWIEHQRTRNLAARFALPLLELTSPRRGLRRYLDLLPGTIGALRTHRPRLVIVQAPSQVLALLVVLLRPFMRYRVILDAHNEAVEPYLHPSAAVKALTHWLLRRADAVIVSNAHLARTVERIGGDPLILPDALPRPLETHRRQLLGPCSVVVISTYAGDEPFAELVEAARRIGPAMHFYVTGNPAKCPAPVRERVPSHMTLTGFLPEEEYWALLASCDVIVDLTTMADCLVCGAYEAVALGKPLLLSRNAASEDLFADHAEFTTNTAEDIAAGLTRLTHRLRDLHANGEQRRMQFETRWRTHAEQVEQALKKIADSCAVA